MLNSSHIQRKIEQSPKFQSLMRNSRGGRANSSTALYLTILSRPPTDDELKTVSSLWPNRQRSSRREAVIDLAWALINSAEFLYRH